MRICGYKDSQVEITFNTLTATGNILSTAENLKNSSSRQFPIFLDLDGVPLNLDIPEMNISGKVSAGNHGSVEANAPKEARWLLKLKAEINLFDQFILLMFIS